MVYVTWCLNWCNGVLFRSLALAFGQSFLFMTTVLGLPRVSFSCSITRAHIQLNRRNNMSQKQHTLYSQVNHTDGMLDWVVLPRPSNFHAHLRTGDMLDAVAYETMRPWKYQLAMPNTGPITTLEKMCEYRKKLIEVRDRFGLRTRFIMTVYLTQELTPSAIIKMAYKDEFSCAVKYYPPEQGATTGSGIGLPLKDAHKVLLTMEECGVPLLGHFESVRNKNGDELPQELREDYFADNHFKWLRDKYPNLRITFEHATTASAIKRIQEDGSGRTTCTITPQAMILVRENLKKLTWGVHGKCMPIAKTPFDRDAVTAFATSGDFRAYLGDDTAPHPASAKNKPFAEAASGCYVPHSLALYAAIFHQHNALHNLVPFACLNGPHAWELEEPDEDDKVLLIRDTIHDIPEPVKLKGGNDEVIPFGWGFAPDAHHCGLKLFDPV